MMGEISMRLYMLKKCFSGRNQAERSFFEVIPYLDARNQAELNLQRARREGSDDLSKWENLFTQTFL